ncbi:hypothetical protein [Streptomyces mirabilis]|uniref:hypothetical protein n=1 Tax=Streptomyces mirabilis TaxID=68239 RepID=UPI00366A29C2
MPTMVVEIHVPLLPTPHLPQGAHPFPWIEEIEDFLADLEDQGDVEVFDDGEEHRDAYAFFVTGSGAEHLLAVASRVATLPGVPAGTFAVVSDDEAGEFGRGRHVTLLPVWPAEGSAPPARHTAAPPFSGPAGPLSRCR